MEKNQPTYRIEFKQDDAMVIIAANIPQMEQAVKFALDLHNASNTVHYIHVIHDDLIDVTFVG